jgi:hypothetical protein
VSINCRELRRRYELDGAQQTVQHLSEALREKHLRPDDFSLRDLAEALVPDGRQWVSTLDPRRGGTQIVESGEAIDLTAFSNITGQVIYAKIMEGMQNEEFVASRMVETIPTRLDGEKIPGVGALGDVAQAIEPGMPYPSVGFGEDWIETPATTKRGFRFPSFKLERFEQTYTRVDENTYHYESRDGEFKRDLTVDEYGMVTNYPGFWTEERG